MNRTIRVTQMGGRLCPWVADSARWIEVDGQADLLGGVAE